MTPGDYAALGYPIFPCRGKRPAVRWKSAATVDPAQVKAWWADPADPPNVGLAVPPGVIVIDVDDLKVGRGLWASLGLDKSSGSAPPRARTGGGGTHLIYRLPEGVEHGNSRGALPTGIDVRGHGGYIVVEPSAHPDTGRPYRWVSPLLAPADLPVIPAPLLAVIRGETAGAVQSFSARLSSTCDRLGSAPGGTRNELLNKAAYTLAGLAAAERIGAAECNDARQALTQAALAAGLDAGEVAATIASAWPAGLAKPLPTTYTGFELTDLGNAERLSARHGRDMVYAREIGWLVWDGKRWGRDDLAARSKAAEVARSIRAEAHTAPTPELFTALAKHSSRSESSGRIEAMLHLAEPMLVQSYALFDRHPRLLNCRNGTLDLNTGELRPHDRADRLTQLCDVEWQPDAEAPMWEGFLKQILPSEAVRGFVRRAAGYSLTGETGEQIFLFLHGKGANGKGTFLATLQHILGEYAVTAPEGLLLSKRNDGHPCELATLRGRRIAVSQETGERRALNEERVKNLTGTDRISARHMHHEFFEFEPTFKIWLATNHQPRIQGTDYAIWRRVRLIPFDVTIPEEGRDSTLPAKLAREAPGILAWAVAGAREWCKHGLQAPLEVTTATREYRDAEDVVGQWIDERCELDRTATEPIGNLYRDFSKWCDEHRERSLSMRHLALKLRERGFRPAERTAVRTVIGLKLKHQIAVGFADLPFSDPVSYN